MTENPAEKAIQEAIEYEWNHGSDYLSVPYNDKAALFLFARNVLTRYKEDQKRILNENEPKIKAIMDAQLALGGRIEKERILKETVRYLWAISKLAIRRKQGTPPYNDLLLAITTLIQKLEGKADKSDEAFLAEILEETEDKDLQEQDTENA